MKLSIIIALYNTDKYIAKCIESIYDKMELSDDEFEVVVINDGSTDRSASIVRSYFNKKKNLILLNKKNGGQSSARNLGFTVAKGKYFFCLDSDDFVDASKLKQALDLCIKLDLDLLPIDADKYDENYNKLNLNSPSYKSFTDITTGGEFMNSKLIIGSMCKYLYKREILENNNLKLTEGIFHEDEEFVTKFISHSKKIIKIDLLVYHQVIRSNSTMNSKSVKHREKLLYDLTTVVSNLDNYSCNFQDGSLENIGIRKKSNQILMSLFLRLKSESINKKTTIEILSKLKEFNLMPINLKYLSMKYWPIAIIFNNNILRKIYLS